MRFLARKSGSDEGAEAPRLVERQPARHCFSCHRARPVYVYAENGHDYCLACAAENWSALGLRPGGRRKDDISLEELIQFELGGPRAEKARTA
jgi:hypothetical protein